MRHHIKKQYWLIVKIGALALLFGVSIVSFTDTPTEHRAVKSSVAGTSNPVDGNVYWTVDYETGDLSQWNAINTGGSWGNSSIQVVTNPVRQGNYAAKFTLTGGNGAHVRAETEATQAQTGGYEGQDWYYSWSMYAPSNPNSQTGWGSWNLVTQWMDLLYQCSPPLQIDILPLKNGLRYTLDSRLFDNKSGCASLGPSQDWDLGPVVYDQWTDFTVHVKWSADPTVGFAQVWINGVNVFPFTRLRTLDTSGGVYMQQDIYRPGATSGSNVLYFDYLRRHDAYNPGAGNTPTPTNTHPPSPGPSITPTHTPTVTQTSTPTPSTPVPSPTPIHTQISTPGSFNQPAHPNQDNKIAVDPKTGSVTTIFGYKNFNPLLFAILPALVLASMGIAVYLFIRKNRIRKEPPF